MNQARKDIVRPWSRLRAAHPDRRGRIRSLPAARLQSRGGRIPRRERRARRRGGIAPGRECARPCDPRLDAAWRLRPRNLPPLKGARVHPHVAGHHGHRAGRGSRAGARPFGRGGRLCGQALLGARTHGARARASQAQPARADRGTSLCRRSRSRPGDPARPARRARYPPRARPSSGCSSIFWKSPAGCSRARNCSTACGVRRRRSTSARSTFMSGRLRKALSRGRERDPIRTVRGTGYAFDETFGKS